MTAGTLVDESNADFAIAAAVHIYYVNDNSVSLGDWTTAVGDDTNDGLSPATPKASIRSILESYQFGTGDVIRVDAGVYHPTTDITLTAADSGVTIEGYHDPASSGPNGAL